MNRPGEALHGDLPVPPPAQAPVLAGPQPVDVLLHPLALPDFGIRHRSDDAGGEVHRAAEHIAFLDVHGAEAPQTGP